MYNKALSYLLFTSLEILFLYYYSLTIRIVNVPFTVEGIKDGHITTGVLNKDVVEDYENRRTTHLMK